MNHCILATWATFPETFVDTDRRRSMTSQDDGMTDEELDIMFHALSDSTRRDIVRRCLQEEMSMSQVATPYAMSFTAVQKHIMVLERAGLVSRIRRGREQRVSSEAAALNQARLALDKLESDWRQRVERMSNLLDDLTLETRTKEDGTA